MGSMRLSRDYWEVDSRWSLLAVNPLDLPGASDSSGHSTSARERSQHQLANVLMAVQDRRT
jgi:hypothetical protein